MAHKKKTYRFPLAIEVEEYHTAKYGAPGQERQPKRKATPEDIEKQNQRNREKKARHKLRAHFQRNDYFSCLTYRREERPTDMAGAREDFRKFIRNVRDAYKKRGKILKWMRNIEVGTRGGWHIHLIVNRIPDTDIILKNAWQHGKVVNELLYEKGGFAKLAAYITKTTKTDPRLREASYSASRNLPIPPPEVKIYRRWNIGKIRIPEGYYLDQESLHEGINPVTGYRYRTYTLLKLSTEQGKGVENAKTKRNNRTAGCDPVGCVGAESLSCSKKSVPRAERR